MVNPRVLGGSWLTWRRPSDVYRHDIVLGCSLRPLMISNYRGFRVQILPEGPHYVGSPGTFEYNYILFLRTIPYTCLYNRLIILRVTSHHQFLFMTPSYPSLMSREELEPVQWVWVRRRWRHFIVLKVL